MRNRRRIAASLIFGVAAAIAFWATNHASPAVQQAVGAANLPALIAALVISGNVHEPSALAFYLAIVMQWAIVFVLASWIAEVVWRRKERRNDV
jgi:Kef-type K+ transport system membrane component KefB